MSMNHSAEAARQAAIDVVKKTKGATKVEVIAVEWHHGEWTVRGTCPIDLEGHPWAEKFEIVIDSKGKVKSTDFGLL